MNITCITEEEIQIGTQIIVSNSQTNGDLYCTVKEIFEEIEEILVEYETSNGKIETLRVDSCDCRIEWV